MRLREGPVGRGGGVVPRRSDASSRPREPLAAATRVARALQVLLLVMFAFFAVSTVPGVRSGTGFVPWLDGWFQGTAYVLIAALAVLLPFVVGPRFRLLSTLVAASVVLRVAAFIWQLSVVRLESPPPYPSLADVGWILSGVLLLVALGLRVGDFAPLLSRTLVLDAACGALFVGGVATVVVFPLLDDAAAPGTPDNAVAVNLAYPLLDLALLITAVGLLAVTRWRLRGPEAVLVAGVALFAVIDVAFLYEVSRGTFHPGTWLSSTSLVATAAIASAGWVRGSTEQAIEANEVRVPGLALPVTVALLSVAVLAYAGLLRLASVRVAEPALLLLVLAVACAVWRGILTVTQDRALLGAAQLEVARFQALVEASQDFIAMADMDNRIVYVNPAGRRMVGLAPDEDLEGTTIARFLTDEGRRRLVEVSGPAVRRAGAWSGPSTLRHVGGEPPTPVMVSTFLLTSPTTGRPFAMATIQRDITALQEAQRDLEHVAEQRRHLLERLVAAQEEERAQIAEDVHDDSVQALAAVDLRLGLLARMIGDQDPALTETLAKAHETVVHATARLRHLLFDLESPAQEASLPVALEEAAAFTFEDTDVRWSVTGEDDVDLPEASRVTAYRVVKEALVNVRKHAGASHVEIELTRVDDGVLVVVRDDGTGFDAVAAAQRPDAGHHGLSNMRDRATVAGGWLHVDASGSGTEVRLWLPHLRSDGASPDPA